MIRMVETDEEQKEGFGTLNKNRTATTNWRQTKLCTIIYDCVKIRADS